MSESERTDASSTDADGTNSGDWLPTEHAGERLPYERLTPRRRPLRPNVNEQLVATGQFVECIWSCPACGLHGTSIARPHMLAGKTCLACGELVSVTTV